MTSFLQNALSKIWDGFLQNLGVLLTALFASGGYLVAIGYVESLRSAVREVPSEYFLTPLVLVMIALGALLRITFNQRRAISDLEQVPLKDEKDARLVTHLGVWWKVYTDTEYIEDFPYCPCCEPHVKLVQKEWHPDEVYECPVTKTEIKLYDGVPRERDDILQSLYRTYFKGLPPQLRERYLEEFHRIKALEDDVSDQELNRRLFELDPLCLIPPEEKEKIFSKNPDPMQAYDFVDRHFRGYRKYFKRDEAGSEQT